MGKGHAAVVAGNLGHEHLGRVDGLHNSSDADFTLAFGRRKRGRSGLNRRSGTAAGAEEQQ
jgi:hypothetical protein